LPAEPKDLSINKEAAGAQGNDHECQPPPSGGMTHETRDDLGVTSSLKPRTSSNPGASGCDL
jgi:hypothetical protein